MWYKDLISSLYTAARPDCFVQNRRLLLPSKYLNQISGILQLLKNVFNIYIAKSYVYFEYVRYNLNLMADHRLITKNTKYGKGDCTNVHIDSVLGNLYASVKEGKLSKVKLLIEQGADVNAEVFDGRTLLHEASYLGHESVISFLIEKGADITVKTKANGYLPIHIAASRGHRQIVKSFLEKGVDVNVCSLDGSTPLFEACYWTQELVAGFLINKGACLSPKKDGCTPLHAAAIRGHDNIVKLLLNSNADINAMDMCKRTPLFEASKRGHDTVVRLLTRNGANINLGSRECWLPIHAAASKGYRSIVKHLIDIGAEVNAKGPDSRTPLHEASYSGNDTVVRLLIKNGADIYSRTEGIGCLPIHAAAAGGHESVVKIFLDNGVDINIEDGNLRTPLSEALFHGQVSVVRLILNRFPDLSSLAKIEGRAPIYAAASTGKEEIVKVFLDAGIDVNIKDQDGRTPLFEASFWGQEEMVKFLVAQGADVNASTKTDGFSSLHTSAARGHLNIVKVLLESGVQVNVKSFDGKTPLYEAADGGNTDIVRFLIERGADIKSKTKESTWTALHTAASKGHTGVVSILLEKGANVNIRDLDYRTPLCEAVRQGNFETSKILIERGANKNAKTRLGKTIVDIANAEKRTDILNLLLNNQT